MMKIVCILKIWNLGDLFREKVDIAMYMCTVQAIHKVPVILIVIVSRLLTNLKMGC